MKTYIPKRGLVPDHFMDQNRYVQLFQTLQMSDGVDAVASYLARNRALADVSSDQLRVQWVDAIRRQLRDNLDYEMATEQIFCELALRGITHVELPPDVAQMMDVEASRLQARIATDAKLQRKLLDEIERFAERLESSKH